VTERARPLVVDFDFRSLPFFFYLTPLMTQTSVQKAFKLLLVTHTSLGLTPVSPLTHLPDPSSNSYVPPFAPS